VSWISSTKSAIIAVSASITGALLVILQGRPKRLKPKKKSAIPYRGKQPRYLFGEPKLRHGPGQISTPHACVVKARNLRLRLSVLTADPGRFLLGVLVVLVLLSDHML
jgi:hypothetical protein